MKSVKSLERTFKQRPHVSMSLAFGRCFSRKDISGAFGGQCSVIQSVEDQVAPSWAANDIMWPLLWMVSKSIHDMKPWFKLLLTLVFALGNRMAVAQILRAGVTQVLVKRPNKGGKWCYFLPALVEQ